MCMRIILINGARRRAKYTGDVTKKINRSLQLPVVPENMTITVHVIQPVVTVTANVRMDKNVISPMDSVKAQLHVIQIKKLNFTRHVLGEHVSNRLVLIRELV